MKSLRSEAYACGNPGLCTHGGALQSIMHIMSDPDLRQNRLGWITEDLRTAENGSDTLYFSGCAPYFDLIFADLDVHTVASASGAVKLLNAVDIVPTVMPNERCCGHDLLWAGDTDHFRVLAEYNVEAIIASGARRVVTACPECYHTLKVEYPRILGNVGFEVVHISELLADKLNAGELAFGNVEKKVTYQDPCRLGRFSGIYAEPRAVLEAIPGLELREMERSAKNALCCGTQAWINCGASNRQIQSERLQEARATGAEALLTFCPKCQIHLKCAQHDKRLIGKPSIEILDFTSLVAEALCGD
jgi:Fe-S oxidoreductase